jgi:hypothetical protein
MKRGEFQIGSYFSATPSSAGRLTEAEGEWRESWEPSIPETNVSTGISPLGKRRRSGSRVVQIEIRESMVRVTVL